MKLTLISEREDGPEVKRRNPDVFDDFDYIEVDEGWGDDDDDDWEDGLDNDYVNPNDVEREEERKRNNDPNAKILNIRPSTLIDEPICKSTIPFLSYEDQVVIGNRNKHHSHLILSVTDNDARDKAYAAYRSENGIVGRIGYYLDKEYGDFPILGAIRAKSDIDPAQLAMTIQRLIDEKLVKADSPFVIGDKVYKAQELLSGGAPEVSDEQEELSRLAVSLHLGTDQYGRRLDAKQKQAIMRKLGMEVPGQVQNKWQQGLQKAGMQAPGQKYWAATSESFGDRLTARLITA